MSVYQYAGKSVYVIYAGDRGIGGRKKETCPSEGQKCQDQAGGGGL